MKYRADYAFRLRSHQSLNSGVLRGILIFVALTLASFGSAEKFQSFLWLAGALAALSGAWIVAPRGEHSGGLSPLSVAVAWLVAWIAVDSLLLQRTYSAFPVHHAALIGAGFLAGRRAGDDARSAFRAMLFFGCALALWTLWQLAAETGARPHAVFDTPATLGAVLNLILLPALIVLAFARDASRTLALLAILLTAAVIAANSRGALLSLAAAGLLALLLARRAGFAIERKRQWMIGAVLACGWLLAHGMVSIDISLTGTVPYRIQARDAGVSLLARLGMYQLAARSIDLSALPTGSGYLSFFYLMRSHPDAVPDYENAITFFVHNDYLQALLELGLPGFAGFAAIAALPVVTAWKVLPGINLQPDKKLAVVALASGLGSMALHALIDFPFYVPASIALYALGLGMLDAQTVSRLLRPIPRVAAIAVATVAFWLIGSSAAAEAASRYARREWQQARFESAAYWFQVAQSLQPGDWRYHWQAGQFWYSQAAASGKPAAARLAERAYAQAYAANPREPFILVSRIALHRNVRPLLANAADAGTLIAWAEEALVLAPKNRAARLERDQLLREFAAPPPDGQNGGLMKQGRRDGPS